MFGLGLPELLIVVAIIVIGVIPIWLVFRFKRTSPNNLIIGCILGGFTPFAQFYPNDKWGWWYFIGMFVIGPIVGSIASAYGGLLVLVAAMTSIVFRIKAIKSQESDLSSSTE